MVLFLRILQEKEKMLRGLRPIEEPSPRSDFMSRPLLCKRQLAKHADKSSFSSGRGGGMFLIKMTGNDHSDGNMYN